jgi:hypothetical protein
MHPALPQLDSLTGEIVREIGQALRIPQRATEEPAQLTDWPDWDCCRSVCPKRPLTLDSFSESLMSASYRLGSLLAGGCEGWWADCEGL